MLRARGAVTVRVAVMIDGADHDETREVRDLHKHTNLFWVVLVLRKTYTARQHQQFMVIFLQKTMAIEPLV